MAEAGSGGRGPLSGGAAAGVRGGDAGTAAAGAGGAGLVLAGCGEDGAGETDGDAELSAAEGAEWGVLFLRRGGRTKTWWDGGGILYGEH